MAPLYSRYIPPPLSKAEEPVPTSILKNGALAKQEEQESSNGRKKRKRVGADGIEQESHKHAKKDKSGLKEKKEHKTREEKAANGSKRAKREDDVEQENGEHIQGETEGHIISPGSDETVTATLPAKHSAVFSKFQKAAERSARIAAGAASAEGTRDKDDDEDQAQPELHGMCAYNDPLIDLSLF